MHLVTYAGLVSHFARQPQVGVIHYGKDDTATLHKRGCAHTARKTVHAVVDITIEAQDTHGDDFFEVAPCLVDKAGTMPNCHGRWACNTANCEGDR